jgi:hypothetical protein
MAVKKNRNFWRFEGEEKGGYHKRSSFWLVGEEVTKDVCLGHGGGWSDRTEFS